MSNKKYSLSYQLLEKKEINVYINSKEEKIIKEVTATLDGFSEIQYDEFLKSIKDAIPRGIENIQNFLDNTRISNILSNLGKTKEEVIDDIEYASEEYTILEVFNELNESNYEFNLTIPDLISSKKISLSFPAVLSLLYIINKSTPIKMQETKKHSLKKIIYEEKTGTVTQQILSSRNLPEFTLGMLEYIKQLNIPKRDQEEQIIKGLFKSKKFSTILNKIVRVNVENNKQFFTNMASDIGNLVEDTMLFKQTRSTNLKPSKTSAKTSLALLMLLKTQGSDSKIIDCRGSDGNWSISFDPDSSAGDFYNSETFNSIKSGSSIKDTDYFSDIENILIPGSNFSKFDEAIESVKSDSALIFGDKEANISITQVFTSKEGASHNPAFDFIFKNENNKFSFIDLKTSNINSGSVGSFPKLGNNQDNSAINAINSLPRLNNLGNNKPMFLGMLKMIYSLYIQRGSAHYFEFDSYMTSYGDVTSSCEYSLKEYEERKEKTKSTSEQKKLFFIHSNIEDSAISQALTRKKSETQPGSKLLSLTSEQLTKLRNYFKENNYTVNSLQPIDLTAIRKEINQYLNIYFDYEETERTTIKITGIKFNFDDSLSYYNLPYIGTHPIVDAMNYLFNTDVNDLQDLDKKYKTFFSDSNKIKVIYYFLQEVCNYVPTVRQFSNDNPTPTDSQVRNIPGKIFDKFLRTVAGDIANKAKFSSPNLKSKMSNLLRRKEVEEPRLAFKHSKKTIRELKVLENLKTLINDVENTENGNLINNKDDLDFFEGPLHAHKEFKGKSLKEVYKNIF